jgi:DNA-directed RNA polymerase specialized sigma24 family protein
MQTDLATQVYSMQQTVACLRHHFPDCYEDVRQDLYIILQGLQPGTLEDKQRRGTLMPYVAAIIVNLKRQRYGKVAKMIKGYQYMQPLNPNETETIEEYDKRPDEFFEEIGNLHPYHEGLIKLLLELGSAKKVAEVTTINKESVKKGLRDAKAELRKIWQRKLRS